MNDRLRQEYLSTIGIQSWQLRTSRQTDTVLLPNMDDSESEPGVKLNVEENDAQKDAQRTVDLSTLTEPLSEKQTAVEADIITAQHIDTLPQAQTSGSPEPETTLEQKRETPLSQSIQNCKKCPGRTGRYNALVGQGKSNARIFIIGDAPTAEEDRIGHYLDGQAGTLFEAMWRSINLLDDCFYTGLVKCYSLENFLVDDSEWDNCGQFFNAQIKEVSPDVLVIYGGVPAQRILNTEKSFNDLRGRVQKVIVNDKEYPVIVTFHPAYLLRNPLFKKSALADLQMIQSLLK